MPPKDYAQEKEEQVGKEYKFWMVWIENCTGPTKKHFTLDDARLEAERLLKLPENRWRIAYVLECMSFGAIESPPVIWRSMTERE
jgi:hypothetical protein